MSLENIRKKIDALDQKIIELLNERTGLAVEIGRLKQEKGSEVYSPERESAIYRKIEALSKGPLSKDALKAIYREVMSASLALEKPMRVAFLGPSTTFTHLAALKKFGSSVTCAPCESISAVFQQVERKEADYGVVPIENSTEGAVNHTLDMFIDSDLKICSEILLEISHHLMAQCTMKNIHRIYSNPQVFGQCRIWLETHVPRAELVDTFSTASAAERASKEDGAAAIGPKSAASLYGLNVLAEGIQDLAHNVTRFLVIARQMPAPSGQDKTSILVSIKDKVGALYEMLKPIRNNRVNMTKIESRPSKKKAWDYYFFIDLEGHAEEKRVKKTLKEIEEQVRFFKVLGSYPASPAA